MRVLVVGSGGREHALVWKISQSRLVDKIFCAPGNGGTAGIAENIDIKADDLQGLVEFCRKEKMELCVIGPEAPLTLGLADELFKYGIPVFGPVSAAARLESSKVFSKQFMARYGVPTASFDIFDDADAAQRYIEARGAPCVVKADGLAAGKGVVVAATVAEALEAVDAMMRRKVFGDAGKRIIVEECLSGQECSILVLTDSREVIPLASSQDHKRIFDGDRGPNTGGMGAYSPTPVVTPVVLAQIMDTVISRTMDGLARENIEYRGVLYAGIMLTPGGPKTLEFNVRFGDPETQSILPRLKSDLVEVMLATAGARLGQLKRAGGLSWDPRACVSVVMAAKGYPGEYEKGQAIAGLTEAACKDVVVFHAGTRLVKDVGQKPEVVTSGGRVLAVTGLGTTIKEAIARTYAACGKIHFEGMQYRKDIGAKALPR